MSLCDRCMAPGACCRKFWLNVEVPNERGPAAFLAELRDPDGRRYPFVPYDIGESRDGHTLYRWNCPKLGVNGRCTIYEDRPNVCRIFEPLSAGLCVHFWPDAGDPTAALESGDRAALPEIDPNHENMNSSSFPPGEKDAEDVH